MRKQVFTDSFWFNGHTGIARFANETACRFKRLRLHEVSCGRGGVIGSAFRPLALRMAVGRGQEKVFWSPGYIPIAKFEGRQCVTVHDLNHLWCYSWAHRVYTQQVLFPMWRGAAVIFTVSEFTRTALGACLGAEVYSKTIVVPNGISAAFFPVVREASRRRFLLYVGNRRGYKNVDRLVRAFARVAKRLEIELYLTGTDDKSLRSLAAEQGVESRLRFIGFPDEISLAEYYRDSMACVFVSLHEGFGLPPLEALACNTPAVVSAVSAMPGVCGPFVRYVNPLEVEDIAAGIVDVVENNGYWRNVARSSASWITRFSWDHCAAAIERVILEQ